MTLPFIWLLVSILIMIVLGLLFVFKKFKLMLCIILMILLSFPCMFAAYLFNPPFKQFYDMSFRNVPQHIYRIENHSYSIPLPKKTIFEFRFSETGVTYLTEMGKNEIIKFYHNIAKQNSFSNFNKKNETILSFEYNKKIFSISIKENTDSKTRYLTIDCKN